MIQKSFKIYLKNYLKERDEKIVISDNNGTYNNEQFKEKISLYKKILEKKMEKKKFDKRFSNSFRAKHRLLGVNICLLVVWWILCASIIGLDNKKQKIPNKK